MRQTVLCVCSDWIRGYSVHRLHSKICLARLSLKFPLHNCFFFVFISLQYLPQVLQAEVKRKKSPCYAPKRKVILDEYPDEVSSYHLIMSSSCHLIILSSYHLFIFSSYHLIILSSYHLMIFYRINCQSYHVAVKIHLWRV